MGAIKLYLLGGFELRTTDGLPVVLPTRKSKALFAYLALNPDRPHSRDKLAALLWGDSGEEQARSSLRQALTLLRKALSECGSECLVSDGDALRFDPVGAEVDVAAFERLAADDGRAALEEAVGLYKGPFLDGLDLRESAFENWRAGERERLNEIASRTMRALLEECRAAGDTEDAIAIALRLLALDSLQEDVHRALIGLYAGQDRRASALRQYEACRNVLERELGVAPDAETKALHHGVLRQSGNRRVLSRAASIEASEQPARPTVAVLPFDNMSEDADQRYFSDGIVEDIITELSRFPTLFVISRNSSFAFRDSTMDMAEVGQHLGARFLVEGSVRKAGGYVRINAQLIDATNGRHLWAERYDRELADIFAVQDDVTRSIVAALAVRLEGAAVEQAMRKIPADMRAYDYWLRGQQQLRLVTLEGDAAARSEFEKALQTEPEYARGHAGMALSYFNGMSCLRWRTWYSDHEKALRCAEQAVALDDTDPLTHWVLGTIFLYRGAYELARSHLDQAISLTPNDAEILAQRSFALALFGEAEAGIAAGATAIRLNPYYRKAYLAFLGNAYYAARRYEPAIVTMLKAPDALADTRAFLAAAFAQAGRIEDARHHADVFRRVVRDRVDGDPLADSMSHVKWLHMLNPFQHKGDADHFDEGLRKAGLE